MKGYLPVSFSAQDYVESDSELPAPMIRIRQSFNDNNPKDGKYHQSILFHR